MNKLIFLFFIYKYIKIISSQCSDSVEITSSIIAVDKNDIRIYFKVKLNVANPAEYIENCIDYLKCSTKSKDVSYGDVFYSMKKDDLDKLIVFNLTNLKPLNTFNISIGFKLKNLNNIISKQNLTLSNCFGDPSQPENLNINTNDNMLTLNWKQPSKINAPYLCYYLITRQFSGQSKKEEFKTNQTRFSFTDLSRDFEVKISAYNDVDCYKNNYPETEYCTEIYNNKTSSSTISYFYKANQNTSTKPSNTASYFSITFVVYYNLILLIIFLFYLA